MPHRRTSRFPAATVTTAAVVLASAASALTAAPAASAAPIPLPLPRAMDLPPSTAGDLSYGDHLTVVVDNSGVPGRDGTYELYCHPAGGSHPDAKAACNGLDGQTTWGKDPFAPVAPESQCTMIYGGPATAHVVGRWAGRPVDARFDRSDGCEIGRWGRMEPLLPRTRL